MKDVKKRIEQLREEIRRRVDQIDRGQTEILQFLQKLEQQEMKPSEAGPGSKL